MFQIIFLLLLAVIGMTIKQLPDFAFRSATDYAGAMEGLHARYDPVLGTAVVDVMERLSLFESDKPSVAALDSAARKIGGNRVTAERRDLFRNPLLEKELNTADAIVLDPPRAGAAAQVAELARSKVPRGAFQSLEFPAAPRPAMRRPQSPPG